MGKTMNSHKSSREKLKKFKNWPICTKHTIFVTKLSRQGQSPEHSRQKFWKIYLCVFRDWKFYLRGSHKVSRENLWVPSWLDLPPANKWLDWIARNIKNPNFEKYSKYFSRLGHWSTSEPWKISIWAHNWDMRLDQPATKSPEQGNTIFEIFDIFAKTKDFPKITKNTQKSFVFDQQGLSMWKHI